jgi:hypothetical protein
MVDLDKKAPAGLVSLAKSAQTTIQKYGLEGHVASVSLVLDISGSMAPLFRDGTVQRLIERVMGLALNFDDNGAIDIFAFGQNAHSMGEFAPSQFADAAQNILQRTGFEGGTRYAPPIELALRHYGFGGSGGGGFLSRLFGGKSTVAAPAKHPVYMIFVTDGDNSDRTESIRVITEASRHPMFIQFMGIGVSSFHFLKELDTMGGRFLDNANFFSVADPTSIPESELYERMMTEYPQWVTAARSKGLIS